MESIVLGGNEISIAWAERSNNEVFSTENLGNNGRVVMEIIVLD